MAKQFEVLAALSTKREDPLHLLSQFCDGPTQALNRQVGYLLREGAAVRIYAPTVPIPAHQATGDLVSVPAIPIPGRREYSRREHPVHARAKMLSVVDLAHFDDFRRII